ncbi:pseudouridine synthase family protein [Tasmannia lanceolata]|uniref:pseudouridine synthase family protein n=1 Tax=Tasmannia lanceolata TaxID=3420 RepID=UPI0040642C53
MTKLPLTRLYFSRLLFPLNPLSSPLPPSPLPIMSEKTLFDSTKTDDQNSSKTLIYPTPLSPPFPPISKQIELNRAISASSKSTLFSLSRTDIIFEDESLIVVNKPSGIYCEDVLSSIPRLLEVSKDSTKLEIYITPLELHLANRLDRDTSGIMVITKSHKVARKLVKAFTDHRVKKTYIALCIGATPEWEKIRLRSGHGRSKFGAWRVYSVSDIGRALPGGSLVRDMETSFEVLSVNGQGNFREPNKFLTDETELLLVEHRGSMSGMDEQNEILVRAYPRSGRTHQIRLHCQYLGIPIRGDVKYEGVHEWRGETCDAHALHAESLSFDHPITGVPIQFCAPLPLWASTAMLQSM